MPLLVIGTVPSLDTTVVTIGDSSPGRTVTFNVALLKPITQVLLPYAS